ncbi:MAG: hypothetical protein KDL31_00650 [Kiritimatiellae bacterium]|nr:hypothetical protein [Kiritimatiellia bacterium]
MNPTSTLSHQPPRTWEAVVLEKHTLSSTGFALSFERKGLQFEAGQLVNVNLPGHPPTDERSYTICSGTGDPYLQILFRYMPEGSLTPDLSRLTAGDRIIVTGPMGEFTIRDRTRPCIFVATGTGIAPARAYLRSQAVDQLTLVHGVRKAEDLFYRDEFSTGSYISCVSSEPGGDLQGRVTDWLAGFSLPDRATYHLCGANEMIYEVRDSLLSRGVAQDAIVTEAYYYRSDD